MRHRTPGIKNDGIVEKSGRLGVCRQSLAWRVPGILRLTRVRDWWGGLYKNFVNMGVAGFCNDMNEPANSSPGSFQDHAAW